MGKLSLQKDGSMIRQINIRKGLTTIGRSEKCDLPVDNPGVSRVHCQIQFNEKSRTFVLHDNGSSNGSFVNGVKIPGQQVLKNGDCINLGKYSVTFETEAEDEISASSPVAQVGEVTADIPVRHAPNIDVSGTATALDGSLSLMPADSPDEALVAEAVKWAGLGVALILLGSVLWILF